MTGPIPAALSNLSNLSELYLSGNQLTGCVPVGLRDVALGELELPDCGLEGRPAAGSFVSVSALRTHTCGVRSNGSVACWGNPAHGKATPPTGSFVSVSAGGNHTCGVRSNGSAACWGGNWDGQSTPPTGSFAPVDAGLNHTCGVRSDGSVACWGENDDGQATPPAGSFLSVSAGSFHTCGVRSNGSVACWGDNEDGRATPPAGSFVSVSAGGFHTCGVRSNGSVACWGDPAHGKATPPAGSFVSVSAGYLHTCGVRSDGSAACWGRNEFGEATPPAGSFVSVSAGGFHTCGVRSDGSVACWGSDEYGQATPPAGSFAPTPKAADPIVIGAMDALTGVVAESYGNPLHQAKLLAVEEINAAGGINGRALMLIVEDSKCGVQDAITAYNKLTDVDGVKIILGTTCSGSMLGVALLAERDGVVLLSASATNPDIASASDYIYRTAINDLRLSIDMGNTLWVDGRRSIATITESTDYAEGTRRTAVEQFEKLGGSVVAAEGYSSDVIDFRSQLTKLFDKNPDALLLAAQGEFSGGTIIKQARELGYDGPIYSEFVPTAPEALGIAGDAATGLKAVITNPDLASPAGKEFLANFKARYGKVASQPWFQGSAYDDVYIAAECLKQTNDDQDVDGFRDCLNNITWTGAIGDDYSFDENGDVVGLSNVVVEVLPTAERTDDNLGYRVLGPAPTP